MSDELKKDPLTPEERAKWWELRNTLDRMRDNTVASLAAAFATKMVDAKVVEPPKKLDVTSKVPYIEPEPGDDRLPVGYSMRVAVETAKAAMMDKGPKGFEQEAFNEPDVGKVNTGPAFAPGMLGQFIYMGTDKGRDEGTYVSTFHYVPRAKLTDVFKLPKRERGNGGMKTKNSKLVILDSMDESTILPCHPNCRSDISDPKTIVVDDYEVKKVEPKEDRHVSQNDDGS